MNPLQQILDLPAPERERQGLADTPREIAQQPNAWVRTAELVREAAPALQGFLADSPRLVLSGAGTSHFIGLSLEGLMRRVGLEATAIQSTEITVDPAGVLPRQSFGLVSFARSGNSPETNHAARQVARMHPGTPHLAITCNPDGELYHMPGITRLLLPPETNDRGLAMTSSYTSMVIAGQGLTALADLDAYQRRVERMAAMAQHILDEYPGALAEAARRRPTRVLFLGTGTLLGAATEAHLKVQEMTGGRVVGKAESFLALRHGPMAVIDEQTLVVCLLSSAPERQRYELDLLRELRAKNLGSMTIAVADRAQGLDDLADLVVAVAPDQQPLADDFRPPVYVVVAQLLALFLSLEMGLKPDLPSDGVINRVVQGVRIYDELGGN